MSGCRNLLWVDSMGGLAVGVAMFALAGPLSGLYGIGEGFLLLMGGANLAYGLYSLTLASRRRRPRVALYLLVAANVFWGALCLRWAAVTWGDATWLGTAHFVLEGLYVGGLGIVEWRCRDALLGHADPAL